MRVLLDHNVPKRTARSLAGHEVKTTRQMGWDEFANGRLLRSANEKFEVFVSIDKNLRYQQNLNTLPLPVVVLDVPSNAFASVSPLLRYLQSLLSQPLERILYVIEPDGNILRFGSPN
jgi:uncharacterized protein DUF5615